LSPEILLGGAPTALLERESDGSADLGPDDDESIDEGDEGAV
jgi:hypothetical protein